MKADELKNLIKKHPKNQEEIAKDIGIARTTLNLWANNKRNISEPDKKLLRLYFYGEMPFELIRPQQDLSKTLKFTGSEWKIISILATREGYTSTQAWITAQIRGYLRNIQRDAIPELDTRPELKVAEEEVHYGNIIDPSTEENSDGGESKNRTS